MEAGDAVVYGGAVAGVAVILIQVVYVIFNLHDQ